MANAIFSFIINSMTNVISVILTPFLLGISNFLPTTILYPIIGLLRSVVMFFSAISAFVSFALSYFAIPGPIISILFLYVILKIQIWLLIETVKFFVYWWNVIKI